MLHLNIIDLLLGFAWTVCVDDSFFYVSKDNMGNNDKAPEGALSPCLLAYSNPLRYAHKYLQLCSYVSIPLVESLRCLAIKK